MVLRPSMSPATVSVLIVYANSSVGVALAQRLFDAADVSLAPVNEALDVLSAGSRHDVVLLCPYLAEAERLALLGACAARHPSPSVLEVADAADPPGAHVRVRSNSAGLDLGFVLEALGLPAAP